MCIVIPIFKQHIAPTSAGLSMIECMQLFNSYKNLIFYVWLENLAYLLFLIKYTLALTLIHSYT